MEAQPREAGTKNEARRVRRKGEIPAIVYGAGKDPRGDRRGSEADHEDPAFGYRPQHDFRSGVDGENSKAMIVD